MNHSQMTCTPVLSTRCPSTDTRSRARLLGVSLIAIAILASFMTLANVAGATTRIYAENPYYNPWSDHVVGKVDRNDDCGGALACKDRTYLERSSWQGYRKIDSSEAYYSTYTNPGCRKGTYNYKTAHRAQWLLTGSITIGVGIQYVTISVTSPIPQWTAWEGDWSSSIRRTCSRTI